MPPACVSQFTKHTVPKALFLCTTIKNFFRTDSTISQNAFPPLTQNAFKTNTKATWGLQNIFQHAFRKQNMFHY